MNNYKAIERRLGKRTYFPNAGDVAYFDPQSQTIHLSKITKSEFISALDNEDHPRLREHFATMLHEVTHWADLVGTVWGRDYLRAVYAALRLLPTVNTPGQESQFHRFIDLHDRTRRLMLSQYFRTVHPAPTAHSHHQPWRIQLSAGREFDPLGNPNSERPVMFVRFHDNQTDEMIARQPIVVGALLEVNAVWSELRTNVELISSTPSDEQAVERMLFQRERLGQLYHPDLTLYTAPAHLVAMAAQTTDVLAAYELGSLVAHVALNLSDEDFKSLVPPDRMKPWAELMGGFRSSKDRGFAYVAICLAGGAYDGSRSSAEWLDEALARVGLGSASSIYDTARQAMQESLQPEAENLLDRAEQYLLSLGPAVFEARASGDTAVTPARLQGESLVVPPLFDANGDLIVVATAAFDLSRFRPEDLHLEAATLHTWTQNFLGACR